MARIMVVEDDVYMREELTDLLRKSGYETASLFDFENAIPEITEYSPDLVLLDINLPFHSGFEICKELKAKQLGTVLVLTARDKLQDELHALGLGADDYLTKPCNIERLLARIKNLLRRKEEQIRQGLLDGNGFLLDPNTFTIYVGKSSSLMPPNEGKILLAPRLLFSIADSADNEQISLSMKDNGTSIPLSDLPFVFDKGFTGDTGSYLSRSTGMGLYLVQKMATDLSITVELKNNSCGGTTVTLTFPKVERPFGR